MNLADSSTLSSTLTTRGYKRVANEADADLIILNTCSIREKAEQRVYGRLGDLYRHKKSRPGLKVAVVGCMAQRLGTDLVKRVPHVDYVLGTDRLFELPDVIEGVEGTSSVMTAFGHENMDMIAPIKESPWSGFVTISRGCDNYCTYCIVPFVRGKEREHSWQYIVDAVKRMVDEGVVEITLLGQNVNSYKYEDVDFPRLLQKVAQETGIRRVRFMTSHPKDLSKRMVDAIADDPRIMPHIHLPLQSGSNRVLEVMGRIYSAEHFHRMVDYINKKLPYVVISTDLIVGYPTETEEEFQQTLSAVRSVQFDFAYMFRYSSRPGTIAAKMPDDVPEESKLDRLNRLIELQQSISYDRNQREVGRVAFGLVEGRSRRDTNLWRARTEGSKTVLFASDTTQAGQIVPVRITAADAFTLHGVPEQVN
jgi:tRNA-2-methylthio-N6-dimethylallyladenosine synthase